MIAAFDTYYYDDKAKTVCVTFHHWTDKAPQQVYTEVLTGIEEYISGQFYKRELPCILSLLQQINLSAVEAIIVDGFVVLDDEGTPGLGGHLYEALNGQVPIIGIAKTNFAKIQAHKKELLRGSSNRPLFITAMGISLEEATEKVGSMWGEHRIPALLKQLDGFTKQQIPF